MLKTTKNILMLCCVVLYSWANQISNEPEPQWVHSVSYGNDERQQITDEYIFSVNVQLMKAGMLHVSSMYELQLVT